MMKKLFLLILFLVLCAPVYAQFGGGGPFGQLMSNPATQDLDMGTHSIDGDSSAGLVFDPDNDGTNEVTMNAEGSLTIEGTSKISSGNTQSLKLNPNANGDVTLFEDIDVGNDEDGKNFCIHRKAAEGDRSICFYTDEYKSHQMNWGLNTSFKFTGGDVDMLVNGHGHFRFFRLSGGNNEIKQYGYITADSGAKWIMFKVEDINDTYQLTREDSNIIGFHVDMPLMLGKVTSDPCSAALEGAIFYNDTANELCFCDASGADLRVKDASTACF